MKKKFAISLILLIVALMCCGCSLETKQKTISNSSYSSQSAYEKDITYKKDADDTSPEVYITKSGKRYHRFGCSHAKNIYIILTVRQAIDRGYTYCYFCCD